MKIEDYIFTDGKIVSAESHGSTGRLVFEDYCRNRFEFIFSDLSDFVVSDGHLYDVARYSLKRSDRRRRLVLEDDDGQMLFRAVFGSIEVRRQG